MKGTYVFPRVKEFIAFIKERHAIFKRRQDDPIGPWTNDPILQAYRFTNVYRELDRVTVWIAHHWRQPYADHPDLWFAMVVARLVNHPDTLAALKYPERWSAKHFMRVLHKRRDKGLKTFGSAYIVSTNGMTGDKASYLASAVLTPMWESRTKIRPLPADTLETFYNRLVQFQGMGSFMAAQIVADMKYVNPLQKSMDWWTFVASGPGSRKGMNYVMDHDVRTRWREHEWRDALKELQLHVNPFIASAKMEQLHAQDLQNCLCEFSKYMRTRLGTGLPKQKFVPFTGTH